MLVFLIFFIVMTSAASLQDVGEGRRETQEGEKLEGADSPWGSLSELRERIHVLLYVKPHNTGATEANRPDDEKLRDLKDRLESLWRTVSELPADDDGLPPADAAIWPYAVELTLEQDEWLMSGEAEFVEMCLDIGLRFAKSMKDDPQCWTRARGSFPLGFRSSIDDSPQQYGVCLPEGFDPEAEEPYRLVVFLHGGLGGWIDDAPFLCWNFIRERPKDPQTIVLWPFARYAMDFRGPAETEVWGAIEDVSRRYPIDPDKIVLTGFSSGGSATFRIGLTSPGRFAAISPFATAASLLSSWNERQKDPDPDNPTPLAPLDAGEISRRLALIVDVPIRARNLFGLPMLMGCGTKDGLARIHRYIAGILDAAEVGYGSYFVEGAGHRWGQLATPEREAFIATRVRNPMPREVTFVTTHLRYAERAWVRIEGMKAHYTPATIHARVDPESSAVEIKTEGIFRFSIRPDAELVPRGDRTQITIDGQSISPLTEWRELFFVKDGETWQIADPNDRTLRKRPGITGPVSDAFSDAFLIVRPTGKPWSDRIAKWSEAALAEFKAIWRKAGRGQIPVKNDADVTQDDIQSRHLILLGDGGSNSLIAKLLAGEDCAHSLPISWTAEEVSLGSAKELGATCVPVLIYPNPLMPERYVVINGPAKPWSRTGQATDKEVGVTLPVLGDFALLEIGEDLHARPVFAGFFDENWAVPDK